MKKTLTANISGTVFHIEEDAYDRLNRYLDSIRMQFTGSSGQEEIMGDIESRIAELLQERRDGRREVVVMADVDHVIGVMGQPEDYLVTDEDTMGAQAHPGSSGASWNQEGPRRKRLFRDPDDKWIGGVLGGIGAYFNVDPLVLRIIYIVLLFLGIGWLIYLILWIVVPVATTAAERLEMRGEPVNVENLKRVFEEGADRVRTGAQTVTQEAQEMGRKYGPQARKGADDVLNFLGELFRIFFTAIAKIVGVVLLLGGAVLAVALAVMLLGEFTFTGWTGMGGDVSNFHDLALVVIGDRGWATLAWAGLIGFILVPVIGLIQGGISLLFGTRTPAWFGYVLTTVWILSIIVLSILGVQVASDLRHREVVETRQTLATPDENILRMLSTRSDDGKGTKGTRIDVIRIDGNTVDLGWVKLDVRQSPDTLYHLVTQRRARGASYKVAGNRAAAIHAGWQQQGDVIDLEPWFSFERGEVYRGQSVRYILEVPLDGAVHFDKTVRHMLDDIDNTSNTRDPQMIGKTWTMTREGLHREGEVHRSNSTARARREEKREWRLERRSRGGSDTEQRPGTEITAVRPAMPDLLGLFLRRV